MKRIGLIGGMSWESTAVYYRLINERVRELRGGVHSADCIVRSLDFAEIAELQSDARWDEAGKLLGREARALVTAGAEVLVLCTNTMHKVAPAIEQSAGIPLLHVADATAEAIKARGLGSVGLVATAYTMEQDFYVGRLRERHGLEVIVPGARDRAEIHRVIYEELVRGKVEPQSRQRYRRVIEGLVDDGAAAILLGCTEIGLLIGADDATVPVFDTTRVHAERAVDLALA